MTTVHVVVPEGIDDPTRPSGGNAYDRQVCDRLPAHGWSVRELPVDGPWPQPDRRALDALRATIAHIPDGAVVLIDGLIASAAAEVLVPQAERVRLVALVHLPLGETPGFGDTAEVRERERDALSSAGAVVATSAWTQLRLRELYALPEDRVHVARPGVEPAALAPGTTSGGQLLCVAAVTPVKGHDLLLRSLAAIPELDWRLECVGSLDRDPGFVRSVIGQARDSGIAERVRFSGATTGPELEARYAEADVLLLASRAETYGMVVTEALARGLPVVASAVGGVPESLGRAADGLPGLLVRPEDPAHLAEALRCWLGDAELRDGLRRAARDRRATLAGWESTARAVARVVSEVAASPRVPIHG